MSENRSELLRALPSVERLAALLPGPRELAVRAAREVVDEQRSAILAGGEPAEKSEAISRARDRAQALARPSLRRVINATGVILHTNLGRAPLAAGAAQAAAEIASGYSNLEYDLDTGKRGSRHSHVEPLLCDLSGAEAAIAVNNNAAAVLLALAATAAGGEVVVGRDALIEIGGSFRIPEILDQSGAAMVEVGTTNRTRVEDFRQAIGERTAALLRVHKSNFRTVGFTESAGLSELCELGDEHGVPVIDDLGSGALLAIGDEPVLSASLAAGASLVCCSADKLLGGPQAGIIVGRHEAVERCRRHPLSRALRLDKLQLAALEWTLRAHRDRAEEGVPALEMLSADQRDLRSLADGLAQRIGAAARMIDSSARPGGGTLPTTEIAGPACAVDPGPAGADALVARLRGGDPAVIARIEAGRVLLDPRTMTPDEAELAADAVTAALA